MKAFRVLIFLCALVAVVSSCKTDPLDVQPATAGGSTTGGNNGGGTGGGSNNPADTALCFERDILPIFISNCARSGCHDAASHQDGYVFTSYQTITSKKFNAGDPEGTELYEKITETDPDDIMPPPRSPRLANAQIELIGRWIREGAKNSSGCASRCDSSKFSYAADIQPVLNTYCRGCHNASSPAGGIALDGYAGARSVAMDGRLFGSISHSAGYTPMPQGAARLDNCIIAKVRAWQQAGAPNN